MGVSLFVALLISAAFSYKNYHDNLYRLQKELSQLEHSIRNSMALHLWQLNMDALNLLLNDLLIDKDIIYVELRDEKGTLLMQKGRKPPIDNVIKRSLPLYYTQDNQKNTYLGRLNYIATTKVPDTKSKKSAINAIFATFIFFIIIGLVILYIYWGSTVKHLLSIKAYMNKIRLGRYKENIDDLTLNRNIDSKNNTKDELDELVDSINEMHHEVIIQYTTVEYQSLHDELTDLPNRRMIKTLISEAILSCQTTDGYGVLYSIDLDHFRLLNESRGHSFGDKVLCEVANRLAALCSKDFQLARISGDEFLILQSQIITSREEAKEHAKHFSEKILSTISQEMSVEDHTLKSTACVGITIFDAASKLDTVIKQADNALHHAKNQGSGHIAFFKSTMQIQIDRHLYLKQLISKVIEKDLLSIHYQPKYDAQKNICSAEALARMHDEENHMISPGEFIPILEQSGAIVEIGDHIIRKVFEFIKNHQNDIAKSGLKSIAINISPTQYNAAGFAERMIMFAKTYEVDPHFIIFEITEEVVAGAIETIIDIMYQLRKEGFSFAIDDFGTGYSSLRYLKNLPLRELKIDKSFVDEIVTDSKSCAIVKTIIDMAHNFNLNVVAEGVESERQFNLLAKYQCNHYQGYLFSKPLTEEDFLKRLTQEKPLNPSC